MADYPVTPRNQVMRYPKRGVYDRDTVHRILDEALVCHVSFVLDGAPFLIPTLHARMDDEVLLHGLKGGRMLKHIEEGNPVAVAVTLLDGLVLARTVFNHSMNYRSVVLYGRGRLVEDPTEKLRGLERLSDQVCPGRWAEARPPTPKELQATSLVAIRIEEASAKIRQGRPGDADDELDWPVWAGVLPLNQVPGTPETDPRPHGDHAVPAYVSGWRRG